MPVTESPTSPSLCESPLREVKNEQETIKYWDDDWENDPQNARNWTVAQKWTAVSIVRLCFLQRMFQSPLPEFLFTSGIDVYFCSPVVQLHDGTGPARCSGDISCHRRSRHEFDIVHLLAFICSFCAYLT